MSTPRMCPCCHERPAPSGLPCRKCWRQCEKRLAELPWLWHELQTTRLRQDRLSVADGPRSSGERPLPWSEAAAVVSYRIADGVAERRGIVDWVRITVEDLGGSWPSGTVSAMCTHLVGWLPALRKHVAAADLCADVRDWTLAILGAINRPEYRRVQAGPCPHMHEDAPCPGVVWVIVATPDADPNLAEAPFARCEPVKVDDRTCGGVWESHQLARLGRDMTVRQERLAGQAAMAREVAS